MCVAIRIVNKQDNFINNYYWGGGYSTLNLVHPIKVITNSARLFVFLVHYLYIVMYCDTVEKVESTLGYWRFKGIQMLT